MFASGQQPFKYFFFFLSSFFGSKFFQVMLNQPKKYTLMKMKNDTNVDSPVTG